MFRSLALKIYVEHCCIQFHKQAPESFLKKGELSNMIFRKFRKNLKAISPIIATLLLIAIAVVAALVVYAWVMGYIGYQTNNAGNQVVIQNANIVAGTGGAADTVQTVYLQNTGTSTVTVNPFVFVNNVEYPASMNVGGTATNTLTGGSTATITLSTPYPTATSASEVTIKVTTTSGTYSQVTQLAP